MSIHPLLIVKLRCGLTYPKYEIVKVHTGVLPTYIISYSAKSVKFPNFSACVDKYRFYQYLLDIIKNIRIGIGCKDSFYIAAIDDKANRVFLSVYIGNPYTSFVLIQCYYLQSYRKGMVYSSCSVMLLDRVDKMGNGRLGIFWKSPLNKRSLFTTNTIENLPLA